MGIKINYWDCKFADYVVEWDGEDEDRDYNCKHKKGCGICDKDNQWNDDKVFCKLAESD